MLNLSTKEMTIVHVVLMVARKKETQILYEG